MKQKTIKPPKKLFTSFKKLTVFTILLLSLSQFAKAQTPLDSLNLQLRGLFGNLLKPTPPKLFNLDMGAHFLDSNLFTSFNTADTLDTDTWVGMYEEMTYCAYDTTILKHVDSVYWPTTQYSADTVNMMVMNFDYYLFKPDALTTNIYFDFDTINDILTDKVIRPGFPYDDFKVFAVAPSTTQTNSGSVVFRVGTDNFFYDQFNKLDGSGGASARILEIDFGDGSGFQNVILGQDNYFNVAYFNIASQVIRSRIRVGNDPDPVAFSISRIHNLQIANFELLPDIGPTKMHNLNVAIYEPCSGTPSNQVKTIIYLEGIDLLDFLPSQNKNTLNIYTSQIFATGLADLRNYGYRFVIVDWANSRIDMNDNAKNVIALINDLKCQMSDANEEQFVIIAESMGGIVARIAMIDMEQNHSLSNCFPEKEHNTRLLVTLDAPHGGAHIPMGAQRMANFLRNFGGAVVGGAIGGAIGSVSGNTGLGVALGVPLGIIGTKLFFKSQDLFLDGDAAKQLLISHVSTSSIIGPITYNSHDKRKALLDDLQAKGNYPKHTKLFAISNGNMMGHGQTRLWDGAPRLDNDTLLKLNARATVRLFKKRFNYAGLDMRINGDPNGTGNIGGINFGTWWIKVKLKWFGLKFYTGFNSLCNKDWDADMRPLTNKAGGIYDLYENYFNGGTILNNNLTYDGQGVWQNVNNKNRFGTSMRFKTDGLHFNFVPVSSALDFGKAMKIPFDQLPTAIITNSSRFDVSMGWKGDTLMGTPTTAQLVLGDNIMLRNRLHTDFRNDTLYTTQYNKIPSNAIFYSTQCIGSGNNPVRPIRMMNREIGDNQIYIENRFLPWQGAYSVSDDIFVNKRSPFYSYPNQANQITTLSSVFSKQNSFIISNSGFGIFNLNIGNLNYNAPFSGPYGQFTSGLGVCCNSYGPRMPNPNTIIQPKPTLSIYPNPTNGIVFLEIVNNNSSKLSYSITDLLGRIINKSKVEINSEISNVKIPIQLPTNIAKGLYLIQVNHINILQTFKINLQ
jgi:Secretion system C-terminal sorting domain